jgi:hypothetical protein
MQRISAIQGIMKNMEIKELNKLGQVIWKDEKNNLSRVIVKLGKIFGDICRWERNAKKDKKTHTNKELKKELGNIIFSTIRFCNDLGYDPEECIREAIESQKKFKK